MATQIFVSQEFWVSKNLEKKFCEPRNLGFKNFRDRTRNAKKQKKVFDCRGLRALTRNVFFYFFTRGDARGYSCCMERKELKGKAHNFGHLERPGAQLLYGSKRIKKGKCSFGQPEDRVERKKSVSQISRV